MGRARRSAGGGLHCCLAFLFKFLAFLQAFAAVSALLYAAWILSRWARHHHLHLQHLLPDLWFVCALMAAGLFYCLLLLVGCVAAEINSPCFLCFYTILAVLMMLLEAALAADLFFNKHWIQDLPYDRTGELDNLLSFIQTNPNLCKWAALAIVATQALSLLLATILRTMLSTPTADYDSDEDFVVIRRPLLVAQGAPAYLPSTLDTRGFHPDLWSSRMRHKVTTLYTPLPMYICENNLYRLNWYASLVTEEHQIYALYFCNIVLHSKLICSACKHNFCCWFLNLQDYFCEFETCIYQHLLLLIILAVLVSSSYGIFYIIIKCIADVVCMLKSPLSTGI